MALSNHGGAPTREDALAALERGLGVALPSEYRAFLVAHGGGEPSPNAFSMQPGWPARRAVARFFRGDELGAEIAARRGRIPDGSVPIGVDVRGAPLVLGVIEPYRGGVYTPISDTPPLALHWHQLHLLADDFGAFAASLRQIGEKRPVRAASEPPVSRPHRIAPWVPPHKKLTAPPPITVTGYRALVNDRLERLRAALVADLRRRVCKLAPPPGTASLDFEVHYHQLGDKLPIVGYWMDGNNGQVELPGKHGGRVVAPTVDILPGKKPVIPARALAPFLDAGLETLAVHTPLLLRWFVSGWNAAGGDERFPLPASIMLHDGGNKIALATAAEPRATRRRTTRSPGPPSSRRSPRRRS